MLGFDEPRRDRQALDEQVRPQLHDVAVLDRARLALVGVDDDDARTGELDDGRPLAERREAGAAVADEPRRLELRKHGLVRVLCPQRLEPAAPLVVGEGLVGLGETGRGPVVRRVRDARLTHARQHRVAARPDRREVAVAEARHLDHRHAVPRLLPCRCEQVASAEAVADGAGAHAHAVVGHLEVRVERHHLRHLPLADVHVVGESVGELGRHRPHAAADRAEIVEELRALARQCVQKGGGHPPQQPSSARSACRGSSSGACRTPCISGVVSVCPWPCSGRRPPPRRRSHVPRGTASSTRAIPPPSSLPSRPA